jgi:hypothetical protein
MNDLRELSLYRIHKRKQKPNWTLCDSSENLQNLISWWWSSSSFILTLVQIIFNNIFFSFYFVDCANLMMKTLHLHKSLYIFRFVSFPILSLNERKIRKYKFVYVFEARRNRPLKREEEKRNTQNKQHTKKYDQENTMCWLLFSLQN